MALLFMGLETKLWINVFDAEHWYQQSMHQGWYDHTISELFQQEPESWCFLLWGDVDTIWVIYYLRKYMYVYIHVYILYIHIMYLYAFLDSYTFIHHFMYVHTCINDEMRSWVQAALISKTWYWPSSCKIFQDEVVKIVKSLNMEPLKLTIPRCGMGSSQVVENIIPLLGSMVHLVQWSQFQQSNTWKTQWRYRRDNLIWQGKRLCVRLLFQSRVGHWEGSGWTFA